MCSEHICFNATRFKGGSQVINSNHKNHLFLAKVQSGFFCVVTHI